MIRATILALVSLGIVTVSTGRAIADPFDRLPKDFGPSINRSLGPAGGGRLFKLERCRHGSRAECHFLAPNLIAITEGRRSPPRTERITIAVDLLKDDPSVDPRHLVAEAATVFGATMAIFDPELQPDRRDKLLSDLVETALMTGSSGQDGIDAQYSLAFDQGADGLFVMTIVPKRKSRSKTHLFFLKSPALRTALISASTKPPVTSSARSKKI